MQKWSTRSRRPRRSVPHPDGFPHASFRVRCVRRFRRAASHRNSGTRRADGAASRRVLAAAWRRCEAVPLRVLSRTVGEAQAECLDCRRRGSTHRCLRAPRATSKEIGFEIPYRRRRANGVAAEYAPPAGRRGDRCRSASPLRRRTPLRQARRASLHPVRRLSRSRQPHSRAGAIRAAAAHRPNRACGDRATAGRRMLFDRPQAPRCRSIHR